MTIRDLTGSVVVVTGAGNGIGAATALRFAQLGSRVVCVDIDLTAAQAVAAECKGEKGHGVARRCDVADYDAMADLATDIEESVGPVAILINNAGVFQLAEFLEQGIDDWRWIRSINLDGVVHGCHAFGSAMVERRAGQVVNIASAAAFAPSRLMNAYSTTKAAVLMFSESLRADWATKGVGVSCICPGVINTSIPERSRLHGEFADRGSDLQKIIRRAGRLRSPERVARAVEIAARKNRGVVMVGAEGHLGRHGRYLLPGPLQERIARAGIPGL
jgi:NAD(P)-dependent dehydrogenase (short-subunit alcohol dehydrogenase family)